MEIIRTAMQATAPVEGAEPIRVEIVERNGRLAFETVWSVGEPQPVTEDVAVTFKYAYAGKPLSEAKEAIVYLDVAQTTEWIKSNTYHYKITLPAGDADITVKVSVGDWDSKDISADW